MLVPDIERVLQLFEPTLRSLSAETMLEPGTVISGLRRPSSVGPQDENDAIPVELVERNVAPTETADFAVDGLPTLAGYYARLAARPAFQRALDQAPLKAMKDAVPGFA